MDDERLLSRWIAGDARAAELLFERYREPLARFFRARTNLSIDDLVQETFVAFVRARDRFRGDASVRTFVFVLARHALYAMRRRERSMEYDAVDVDDVLASTIDEGHAIEDVEIDSLLTTLDTDLREVISLFYWRGLCTREIATHLHIPEGTVSSRLRRAREQLRAHLGRS